MLYLLKSTNQFIRGKNTLKHHEDMRLPYVNLRVDKPDILVIKDSSNSLRNISIEKHSGSTNRGVYYQTLIENEERVNVYITVKILGYSLFYITIEGAQDRNINITSSDLKRISYYIHQNTETTIPINSYTAFVHIYLEAEETVDITVFEIDLLLNKKSMFFDKKVITEEDVELDNNKYALISLLKSNRNTATSFLTKKLVELPGEILNNEHRNNRLADDDDLINDGNIYNIDLSIFKNIKYSRIPRYCLESDNIYITDNSKTNYYFQSYTFKYNLLANGSFFKGIDETFKGLSSAQAVPTNFNILGNHSKYTPYISTGNTERDPLENLIRQQHLKGHIKKIGKFAFKYSDLNTVDIILGTDGDSRLYLKLGSNTFAKSYDIRKVRIFTKHSLIIPPKCFHCCYNLEEVEIFITGGPRKIKFMKDDCFNVVFYKESFSHCCNLRNISVIGLNGTGYLKIYLKAFSNTKLEKLYTDGILLFINSWNYYNGNSLFPNSSSNIHNYIWGLNCYIEATDNQHVFYAKQFNENISPSSDNYATIMNSAMASNDANCLFIEI